MRKVASIAVFAIIVVVVGVVIWREIAGGAVGSSAQALLTPVPGAVGFEPKTWPSAPVLKARTTGALAVDFGYEVGGVTYAYALNLTFPPGGATGRAKIEVSRDGHVASTESDVTRRWDEPRKAYAIAIADKFMVSPPVPALCIKAVLGPDLSRYDLSDGTICVAQRGADGSCHPETLACGLLR